MTIKIGLLLAAALLSLQSRAEEIDTAELGLLELEYATVSTVATYAGRPIAARASYRAGDALSLVTTPRLQQVQYLVEPGAPVALDQPIARLSGPEVNHFLTEFEVLSERLAVAERRFQANRDLYQQKSIDESRWMLISEAYYALKLEHEHLLHFRELLEPDESGAEGAILKAPAAGTLTYTQPAGGLARGGEVARIIPVGALRLKVAVSIARRREIAALSAGECTLNIAQFGGVAEEFRVTAWSDPLTENCAFLPEQPLMATPWYRGDGFRVPARSVLQWRGQPAVLVREDSKLVPRPVELLGSWGTELFVRSAAELDGKEVLNTSVSAVQGILLGLGGE